MIQMLRMLLPTEASAGIAIPIVQVSDGQTMLHLHSPQAMLPILCLRLLPALERNLHGSWPAQALVVSTAAFSLYTTALMSKGF
jgi:hypothetical protein